MSRYIPPRIPPHIAAARRLPKEPITEESEDFDENWIDCLVVVDKAHEVMRDGEATDLNWEK